MAQNKSKLPLKQGGTLAVIGLASAAVLAGCGGATTNQPNLRPTQAQSVVAFGVNATAATQAGTQTEISGLGSSVNEQFAGLTSITPANQIIFTTGAVASTAIVQATIAGPTGTIPLGFPQADAGGPTGTGFPMRPILPNRPNTIFGVAIANGVNTTTNALYPVGSSTGFPLVLQSSEVAAFSQPLVFVGVKGGALANATYQTAAFTLPFSTTGLHSFTATVSDSKPESTTTTYEVAVLAPSAGMLYLNAIAIPSTKQNPSTAQPISPGDTVTVTGDLGVTEQKVADAFGTVILFATPGTQTLTYTSADGKTTLTQTVTVTAGYATVQSSSSDAVGNNFINPTVYVQEG